MYMTSILKVFNNMEIQRGNKIVNYIVLFYISILFTLPALHYKPTEKRDQGQPKRCSTNV
jgi:hypothetical protein